MTLKLLYLVVALLKRVSARGERYASLKHVLTTAAHNANNSGLSRPSTAARGAHTVSRSVYMHYTRLEITCKYSHTSAVVSVSRTRWLLRVVVGNSDGLIIEGVKTTESLLTNFGQICAFLHVLQKQIGYKTIIFCI